MGRQHPFSFPHLLVMLLYNVDTSGCYEYHTLHLLFHQEKQKRAASSLLTGLMVGEWKAEQKGRKCQKAFKWEVQINSNFISLLFSFYSS
jgi:hypothetical protein